MNFTRELYQNPLTKLPNFLSFVRANFQEIFDESGMILFFEIAQMAKINQDYGTKVGDHVLSVTSQEFLSFTNQAPNASVFHFGGDVFLFITNNHFSGDIVQTVEGIENKICRSCSELGVTEINFHKNYVGYNTQIRSIQDFYRHMVEHSQQEGRYQTDFWIFDIVRQFTKNIEHALVNFEKASNLALYDDISGLQNHRAAMQYFENMKMNRASDHSAVLFIDGDNLKRYNTLSYQAGNDMIKNLAQIITNSVREEDLVFRWLSGDEFLCILKDVDASDASILAERVRKAVETATLDWIYPVTISIGLSFLSKEMIEWNTVVDRAAQANAQAKCLGKNRTVVWQPMSSV